MWKVFLINISKSRECGWKPNEPHDSVNYLEQKKVPMAPSIECHIDICLLFTKSKLSNDFNSFDIVSASIDKNNIQLNSNSKCNHCNTYRLYQMLF